MDPHGNYSANGSLIMDSAMPACSQPLQQQSGGFHNRPINQPMYSKSSASNPAAVIKTRQAINLGQARIGQWIGQYGFTHQRPPSNAPSVISAISNSSGMTNMSNVTALSVMTDLDAQLSRMFINESSQQENYSPRYYAEEIARLLVVIRESAMARRWDDLTRFCSDLVDRLQFGLASPEVVQQYLTHLVVQMHGLVTWQDTPPKVVGMACRALLLIVNRVSFGAYEIWRFDVGLRSMLPLRLIQLLMPGAPGIDEYVGQVVALISGILRVDRETPHANRILKYFMNAWRNKETVACLLNIIAKLKQEVLVQRITISVFNHIITRQDALQRFAFEKGALQIFLEILKNPEDEEVLFICARALRKFIHASEGSDGYGIAIYRLQGVRICANLLTHGSTRLLQEMLKLIWNLAPLIPADEPAAEAIVQPVLRLLGTSDAVVVDFVAKILDVLSEHKKFKQIILNHGAPNRPKAIDELFSTLQMVQPPMTQTVDYPEALKIFDSQRLGICATLSHLLHGDDPDCQAQAIALICDEDDHQRYALRYNWILTGHLQYGKRDLKACIMLVSVIHSIIAQKGVPYLLKFAFGASPLPSIAVLLLDIYHYYTSQYIHEKQEPRQPKQGELLSLLTMLNHLVWRCAQHPNYAAEMAPGFNSVERSQINPQTQMNWDELLTSTGGRQVLLGWFRLADKLIETTKSTKCCNHTRVFLNTVSKAHAAYPDLAGAAEALLHRYSANIGR
ncbi:unnamed protein product, partial [Mesorhabditis spiculigera]